MALAQHSKPAPTHCPRCNGPMYQGYEDESSCLLCGEYVFANPLPAPPVDRLPTPPDGPRKRGRPRKHPVAA